jgi:hypothetical protein
MRCMVSRAAALANTTKTRGPDLHIRPGNSQIKAGLHGRRFCVLAKPVETLHIPVETPHIVRMLSCPTERIVQPQVSLIHLHRLCYPVLL